MNFKYSNIILDSKNQNFFNSKHHNLNFKFNNNDLIPSPNGKIRYIHEIELLPIHIPYLDIFNNNYNKIIMIIKELNVNSDCNQHFHFILSTSIIDNIMLLVPENKFCKFQSGVCFGNNNISIEFKTFDDKILHIPNYKIKLSSLVNSSIEFKVKHNLINNDIIYISNFTTLNKKKDINIINFVNRKEGHAVTVNSEFKIHIHIDDQLSKVKKHDTNQNINIVIGAQRIIIPMIFKYSSN